METKSTTDTWKQEVREILTQIEIADLRASALADWKVKRGATARLLKRAYDVIETAKITGLPMDEVEAMSHGREPDHVSWIAEQSIDFEQRVGGSMSLADLEAVFQRIWAIRVNGAELYSPQGETLELRVRQEVGYWILSREMWERDQFSRRAGAPV